MAFVSDFDTHAAFQRALDASGLGGPVSMFLADRGRFDAHLFRTVLGPVTVLGGRSSLPAIVRVDSLAQPCITFRANEWSPEPPPLRTVANIGALAFRTPGMEHFFAHSGGGRWAMLLIAPEKLQTRFESLIGRKLDISASLPRVITPPQAVFADLIRLHTTMTDELSTATPVAADERLADMQPLADAIVDAAVRCLDGAVEDDRAARRRHAEMLKRMRAVIEERPEEPLQINDLCTLLNVSNRTLHAVCQEHFGMGPKRYLTLRRLELARRALQAAPEGANVTAVALRCGFWELGRFAGAYKLAFGESPSETLRRAS